MCFILWTINLETLPFPFGHLEACLGGGFGLVLGMLKFPGQGLNPHHSSDPRHMEVQSHAPLLRMSIGVFHSHIFGYHLSFDLISLTTLIFLCFDFFFFLFFFFGLLSF